MINNVNDIRAFTVVLNENLEEYLSSTKRINKSVEKSKELFPNFQIYTLKDEIVQEALKKYKEYLKQANNYLPFISDVVRIYILANTDKNLYLDTDVYIYDLESFIKNLKKELKEKDRTLFIDYSFSIIYKGEEKKVLNCLLLYYSTATEVLVDYLIIEKFLCDDCACSLHSKGYFHYTCYLFQGIIIITKKNIIANNNLETFCKVPIFVLPLEFDKNSDKEQGINFGYIPWYYIYDFPEEFINEMKKKPIGVVNL